MLFVGDPAAVVDIPCEKDDPLTQGMGGGDSGSARLKEEDRLAAVVHSVSVDAWCIPRGALCRTPDGCILPSAAFQGLPAEEATDLCSWQHARVPKNKPWNYNLLHRRDYNYALDFLDICDEDVPGGTCWSVQICAGDEVVVRSLSWPGAVGYHRIGTQHYGWFYLGNGKCNLDLPHMLPSPEY